MPCQGYAMSHWYVVLSCPELSVPYPVLSCPVLSWGECVVPCGCPPWGKASLSLSSPKWEGKGGEPGGKPPPTWTGEAGCTWTLDVDGSTGTLSWHESECRANNYCLRKNLLGHYRQMLSYRSVLGKEVIGLIWVKEEGRTGFSKGLQGCSKGFHEGEARGKSWGAALPAQGKPCPSRLFYSDLHSISNTVFQSTEVIRQVNFFNAILVHFWWQIVNSDTTFFSWIFYAEYFCE